MGSKYKIAAIAVLLVCFGLVAIIISSAISDEEQEQAKVVQEVSAEQKNSVADVTMKNIEQSKEEAAYRIEVRRRSKELDEELNNPTAHSYRRNIPASAAPSGLNEAEKKDYEQRSGFINSKRQLLEETLRRTAKRQAEGGFPVEDDYIQNELDRFDAKYGKWD